MFFDDILDSIDTPVEEETIMDALAPETPVQVEDVLPMDLDLPDSIVSAIATFGSDGIQKVVY